MITDRPNCLLNMYSNCRSESLYFSLWLNNVGFFWILLIHELSFLTNSEIFYLFIIHRNESYFFIVIFHCCLISCVNKSRYYIFFLILKHKHKFHTSNVSFVFLLYCNFFFNNYDTFCFSPKLMKKQRKVCTLYIYTF